MPRPARCEDCGREFEDRVVASPEEARFCPRCWEARNSACEIFCLKCLSFVGLAKSGKQPNGYVIKPHEVLHVNGCPRCSREPDGKIIELEEFDARNNQVGER